MRPGLLVFGVLIVIFSAAFYYIPKVTATPANPDGIGDALEGSLSKYWSVAGLAIGAGISILALILPRARVDLKKSPMKEYARTSAAQDEGTGFNWF